MTPICCAPGLLSTKFASACPAASLVWLAWKMFLASGDEIFWLTAVETTQGTPLSSMIGRIASATPLHTPPLIRKTWSWLISFLATATPLASLQAWSPTMTSILRPCTPPFSLTHL